MKCIYIMITFIISMSFFLLTTTNVCAAKYEWKMTIEEVQDSIQEAYALNFINLLEKYSNGDINVELYHYGELGTISEANELLQGGTIELAMVNTGWAGSLVKEVMIFDIPYMFPKDKEVFRKVTTNRDAKYYNILRDAYSKQNMHLIDIWGEGWQQMTTKTPIRELEDLKGLKMRVMGSPLLLKTYRLLGANPTTLPFGEVYSALQLNMIDGQENPIDSNYEMKFFEVTDYLTITYNYQMVETLCANLDFYNDLPQHIKDIIVKASLETNESFIYSHIKKVEEDKLKLMKEKKPSISVEYLSDDAVQNFKKATLPVRDEYIKLTGDTGKECLNSLLDEIEKAKSK